MVVGKDVQRNRLILGYEDASTRGLYASRAVVGGISNTLAPLPARVMAQPRYRAKAEWASCEYLEEGKVRLGFDTPSGPWPWDRSAPFTTEASCSGAAFLNP